MICLRNHVIPSLSLGRQTDGYKQTDKQLSIDLSTCLSVYRYRYIKGYRYMYVCSCIRIIQIRIYRQREVSNITCRHPRDRQIDFYTILTRIHTPIYLYPFMYLYLNTERDIWKITLQTDHYICPQGEKLRNWRLGWKGDFFPPCIFFCIIYIFNHVQVLFSDKER